MYVIKRDGEKVPYDLEKISIAIAGAFNELNHDFEESYVLDEIEKIVEEKGYITQGYITVEQIQDIVEEALCDCGYIDEARAYMKYRYDHELKRAQEQKEVITEKLTAANVVNQNANVDEHSFGGRIGEVTSAVMKQYALDHCMSKMAKKNHENNEIYIHDLDSYAVGMHNCLSIPFDDLLANGFNTRQTDVRPANSINTAMQLVAVIFQLQSLQQFGGVSATHLDWTMVPYVRKSFVKHYLAGIKYIENIDLDNDKYSFIKNHGIKMSINSELFEEFIKAKNYAMDMTEKECQQAVEGMYHNLNTLQSRSGN